MRKIFFIVIVVKTSFLFAMDNDVILNYSPQTLLDKNGNILKNLIVQEEMGNYVSELLEAEKTLQQFWEKITPKERSSYSKGMKRLIQCIIDRPQVRQKLFNVVTDCRHKEIKYIVKKNPYVIHSYGYQNKVNNVTLSFLDFGSILGYAVTKDCNTCVGELIACGANVNALNKYGQTPIFSAKNCGVFNLLLSFGAFLFVVDNKKRNLLHFYVKNSNYEGCRCLLSFSHFSKNINTQDDKGDTALHKAMKSSVFDKHKQCLKLLLKDGASLEIFNFKDKTPLDLAILYNDKKTKKILKKYGYLFYDFRHVSAEKNPYYLLKNNASCFKLLSSLKNIANEALAKFFIFLYSNEKNHDTDKSKIICTDNAFIVKKATVENLKDYFGQDSISFVKKIIDNFIVKQAIDTNNTKWLRQLLNTSFSLDEAMSDALHYAIDYDKYNIIPLLLKHGSDCSRCDEKGRTPLQSIEAKGDARIVTIFKSYLTDQLWRLIHYPNKHKEIDFLLQNGANPHYCDIRGYSFFHCDISNHGCYARELIKAKVNINQGVISPLLFAVVKHNTDYVTVLLQNGARSSKDIQLAWLNALNLDMIKAIIAGGVVVNNEQLEYDKHIEKIKNVLIEAHKNQECCICLEHNNDLSYIPCDNIHANYFLCERCYKDVKSKNDLCPLCRNKLNFFVTA